MKPSGGRRFSPKRFRGVVEHILSQEDMVDLTLGKLCNMLYLTDFEAYRQLGASITGATYIKLNWGAFPVVKSHPRKSAFASARMQFYAPIDLLAAASESNANEIRIGNGLVAR